MTSAHETQRGSLHRLDLNLLLAFDALRIEGSVSRAAGRVGITQSGMSRALARLRDRFGDPLFVRAQNRMVLTPFAEVLAQSVSRALDILAAGMSAQAPFDPATAQRTFTIATADYCEAVFLPALLDRLRREAPGIRINSIPTLPGDAEALTRGDADLVIALRIESRADLRTQKLIHEEFASVVRIGHPALVRGEIPLADFLAHGHVVVAPHGRPGSPIDDALAKQGVARATVVRLQGFMAALALIEGTDLITTLPRQLASRMASRFHLQVVAPPIALDGFDLTLNWHERCQEDPGHRWLRRLWTEIAGALQPPGNNQTTTKGIH
jgi:DNA-binding transcriptional LysR family regulator